MTSTEAAHTLTSMLKISTSRLPCTLAILTLWLTLTASSLLPATPTDVQAPGSLSPDALRLLEGLHATRMNVDRHGQLCSWNGSSGALRVISPEGQLVHQSQVEHAQEVDFDLEWGLLVLDHSAKKLRWTSEDDAGELDLDSPAGDLCWVGPGRIALSPTKSAHRIEIWDLKTRQRSAAFGEEQPVPDGPGLHRLRHVRLQFDFRRSQLWSFDTFTGKLAVFDLAGKLLRETVIKHPKTEEIKGNLQEHDRNFRESGKSDQTIVHLWPALGVDFPDRAFLVEKCQTQERRATLIEALPDGSLERRTVEDVDCCSSTMTLWGDSFIFHRNPQEQGKTCTQVRKKK